MVNTTYNSLEDMINKLQELKRKTNLYFYKNLSNNYNEMKNRNFQTQEDPVSKNAQGINESYHEVILLMKYLQTNPQVKNMKSNYYDLYYTVIKIRDDNEIVNDKFENNENDFISLNDVIIPNHYVGLKCGEK